MPTFRMLPLALLVLVLTMAPTAQAQFAGTIAFSMETTMPNQASLPANIKAMMQANLPTQMTLTTNGKHLLARAQTASGKIVTDILTTTDGTSYLLDHAARKAYRMQNEASTAKAAPKVTRTGETKTIAGYTCTRYVIEPVDSKYGKQVVWVAKDLDMPAVVRLQAGGNPYDYTRLGIQGMPLRTEMSMDLGAQIVMTAQSVTKRAVSADELVLPPSYAVEPFSSEKMRDQLMRMP